MPHKSTGCFMSNYFCLDQALQLSGYAVFNENKTLITYGTFKTKNDLPIDERLGSIWNFLNDSYEEYNFIHVFFEDCQQQQNAQTYHKLSMVKAVVLLWCFIHNIPYTVLSPSHWRSLIKEQKGVSFGRARKEQKKNCQDFIEQEFQVKVSEDEADAIAIGFAGFIELNKNTSAF